MLQLGVRGRRIILQVVDLSSAFVGPTQNGPLHREALEEHRAGPRRRAPSPSLREARPAPRPEAPSAETVEQEPALPRRAWSGVRRRVQSPPRPEPARPAIMYDAASTPSGVPAAFASRSMSPVEICGMPHFSQRTLACVPLPAAGGPRRIKRALVFLSVTATSNTGTSRSGQAFVVAGDEVGLNLADGVERDADDDHDRGAAEAERDAKYLADDAGDDADGAT